MNKRSTQWLQRMSLFGLTIILMASMAIGGVQNVSAASLIVDDDYTVSTPGWDVTAFATIQDAVDAAAINDTIEVKDGIYTEQVSITKNLTLFTTEGAVIQAFPEMLADCTSDLLPTNHPIVCVKDTSAVTIQGFTIDGLSLGNSVVRLIGIAFRNAGGTAQDNIIQNIRFTDWVSGDEGVGIYLYNSDVVARTVNILDNTVTNFNKNGITVTTHGAWDPITFNIQGNTISGIPNSTVAQNGIQVYVPRGSGVIQENILSNIAINNAGKPIPLVAASILSISTPVDTLNNVITGAQAGIVYFADLEDRGNHREISGNQVQVFKPGTVQNPGKNVYGILVTDRSKDILSPVDPPALDMLNAMLTGVPISMAINNNTVSYTGILSNTKTFGIEIDAGVGTSTDPGDNVLSVEVTGNHIGGPGTGFDAGLVFYQCDPADLPIDDVTVCGSGYLDTSNVVSNNISGNNYGVLAGGSIAQSKLDDFHHNRIAGNSVGVQNDTGLGISLVNNWWGCNAGPGATGCDTVVNNNPDLLSPRLVLSAAANPTSVPAGGTTVFTANLIKNSLSADTSSAGFVPNGIPVNFSATTLGSVDPASSLTNSGTAQTTVTAPLTYGFFEVCATVDNQEVCSQVLATYPYTVFLPSISR